MKFEICIPDDLGTLYTRFTYPAGESQVRLTEDGMLRLRRASKLEITLKYREDSDLMTLLELHDALTSKYPHLVADLLLPYLPYSRADREFTVGDCHGLRTFGKVLSISNWHDIKTLDIHSTKFPLFGVQSVSPLPYIFRAIQDIASPKLALLFPDDGAAKRYPELNALGLPSHYCTKEREPVTGKLLRFHVPTGLEGYDSVLIVDDLCDGGGTFIGIADTLKHPRTYLWVTHGIFSKGFGELRPRFMQIYTTDTFQGEDVYKAEKFPIRYPYKPLLASAE